jgi:hypothetical protein
MPQRDSFGLTCVFFLPLARDRCPRSDDAGALPRATSRARGFALCLPVEPSRAQRLLNARVVLGPLALTLATTSAASQNPIWISEIGATSSFAAAD